MRLIDADALRHSHCVECSLYPDKCLDPECDWDCIYHIDHAPTIEAEPIKHGKWEIGERMPFGVNVFLVRCSECGKEALDDGLEPMWRYCPKCGAKMDGAQP